jgi:hypothetical protein
MPRVLSTAFRKSVEMRDSPALIVCFVTITHPELTSPIYIASEDASGISRSSDGVIINYNLDGHLHIGLPFFFDLVSDNDQAPVARMAIPDVERSVGLALLAIVEAPVLTLEVCSSADFGTSLDGSNARSPLGSPTPRIYTAPFLRMRNINSDQVMLQSDLQSFDFTSEPWPYHRVTKDIVPGAYW